MTFEYVSLVLNNLIELYHFEFCSDNPPNKLIIKCAISVSYKILRNW